MSKVTLLDNKTIVAEKIKQICDSFDSSGTVLEELGGVVFSETLQAQYTMMRNHLNKNSLIKRFFDSSLMNRELLNAYYGHMYMHNHIAFEDEVFEALDAIDGMSKASKAIDRLDLKRLLVLEELIDIYHFLLEYTCILKEHFLMQTECLRWNSQKRDFTIADLADLLTVNREFGVDYYGGKRYDIFEYLELEGRHIAQDIFSKEFSKTVSYTPSSSKSEEALFKLLWLNREFVRNCNFKDWKNYPVDFYNAAKFAELSNITRKMYYLFVQVFSFYRHIADILYDSDDRTVECSNPNYAMAVQTIYGIYMAKREENIRRQKNDPRYTGKSTGEVVGIDV